MLKEAAPEMNASSSEAEEEKEEQPKVDGDKDPDFSQVSSLYYSNKLRGDGTHKNQLRATSSTTTNLWTNIFFPFSVEKRTSKCKSSRTKSPHCCWCKDEE